MVTNPNQLPPTMQINPICIQFQSGRKVWCVSFGTRDGFYTDKEGMPDKLICDLGEYLG